MTDDAEQQVPMHIRMTHELQERLPMWVVYRPTAADHPGQWSARMHLTLPEAAATTLQIFGETLHSLRDALPPWLHRQDREAGDDPVIEEVWF